MNTKKLFFYVYALILIILLTSLTGFSVKPQPLQATLASQALFTGRFDFSDPSKVTFSNNGSSIKANFNGTGISVLLGSETGASATQSSFLYVIVDGIVTPANHATIQVSAASATFVLASGLTAGNHTVELVKETEYDTRVAFYGFTVTGGTLSAIPARPSVRLEFYGDSNAAGWDAYDPTDTGTGSQSGGYYTYPGITSRMLNAEYSNIARSGAGITDASGNGNLINYYQTIHQDFPASGTNLWDFSSYTPHAVIINASSNDIYGSTQAQIMTGWKTFVSAIRAKYPSAQIVIAESHGWGGTTEPASYLATTVSEINAAGDAKVSYVLFPWLWNQNHAVINEHAGFANILAAHLATKLGLAAPTPSTLSSFAPYGSVFNGSFEISNIAGYADGWRPEGRGTKTLVTGTGQSGTKYFTMKGGSIHYANSANPGSAFTLKGWLKGAGSTSKGTLQILFKDRSQVTLATSGVAVTPGTSWKQYTITGTAPSNTWAIWVNIVTASNQTVSFDNITLTSP